jgi:hypothetical protein
MRLGESEDFLTKSLPQSGTGLTTPVRRGSVQENLLTSR